MKVCIRCGELKPLSEFGIKKNNRDNHETRCRSCINAYWRERRDNDLIDVCYEEQPLKTIIRGRPWKVISTPCDEYGMEIWDIGGRFSPMDVSITLRRGYFSEGMMFEHITDKLVYTVVRHGDCQILKNGRYCLVPFGNNFKKVLASELDD